MKVIHASGKRKSAVARASLRMGSGVVRLNSQLVQFAFPLMYRLKVLEPVVISGDVGKIVDIDVNIFGGGISAQAEAARVAIANSLAEFDKKLEDVFMQYDRTLLVADVRRKEKHKPCRHGKARAKIQKSYR